MDERIFKINVNSETYIAEFSDGIFTKLSDYTDEMKAEKWDYKYINSLPDAAFAIVFMQGSTKIRKLPHHNKNVKNGNENSTVDKPHLRNALARLPQIKGVPASEKAKGKRHLEKHAKTLLNK